LHAARRDWNETSPPKISASGRRRFIATTDSDHNYPIFPDLAKNMKLDAPNQLWVADITCSLHG